MIRDHRYKPAPWAWSPHKVERNCRWAVRGLWCAWPVWENRESSNLSSQSLPNLLAQDPIKGRHGFWHTDAGSFSADGGLTPGANVKGFTLRALSDVNYSRRVATLDMVDFPTKAITVVLPYGKLDSTNRSANAFGSNGTGTAILECLLPYVDGTVYWIFGSLGSFATASGLTFNRNDVWIFTVGPRGMEIWQNGKLVGTGTASVLSPNSTDRFGFASANRLGISPNDIAEWGGLLVYDHQKSEAEIMALTIDPWTPFRRDYRLSGAIPVSSFPVQFDGLKAFYGAVVNDLCLVAIADAPTGMGGVLKINKNGTIYAAYLVDTSDPNASSVRVRTSTGTKAIRLKT